MNVLYIILFVIAIFFAFLAIEANTRLQSILLMVFSTIALGMLFIAIGAVYAGIFQLLVYSGVLSVLFAATAYILETIPVKEDEVISMEVSR